MSFHCLLESRVSDEKLAVDLIEDSLYLISSFLLLLSKLPRDPAIPLLDIYPRELKTGVQTKTCTHMLIPVLPNWVHLPDTQQAKH